MSEDSNPKNDLKLKMYETFRSHIERAENSFWTYMLFYLQFLVGINGAVGILCRYLSNNLQNFPTEIIIAFLALVNILLSLIGIIVIIERGKWFFRNMILTVNLERYILKEEHIKIIPKRYSKFDNFNKVIDTTGRIFISIFIGIYMISVIALGYLANSCKTIILFGTGFFIIVVIIYFLDLLDWIYRRIDSNEYRKVIGVVLFISFIPPLMNYFIYDIINLICSYIPESFIVAMIVILIFVIIDVYYNAKKHIENTIIMLSLERTVNDIDDIIKILKNIRLDDTKKEELKKKLRKIKKLIENVIKLLGGTSENGTQNNNLEEAKSKITEACRKISGNNIFEAINELNEAKYIINNKINELTQSDSS
ncbi:TPA: hypothetical protein HA335_04230 [Methanocaldococcus jannaschii]|uniref:Uncharacterized protein MJ0976 n=2 Tax=Methanocaldococcus jannaschii TaxID=2190 RepID=Y976_METJA|nr:hypothetical protein [Methanocaldococcus jannaschii]Q58386.1 RecName: Full=Uncharacterized protein MJ0976 [Methanocaldococcus jannaschii DSM 2661]AAB98982.1 hypothetical protein MJ_0976 [Methanocaldococcus jannaschii DSM 2661]HII59775.1 hypothetical protein [Methanocaldococcus jannaschii]